MNTNAINWDDAFDNVKYIPEGSSFPTLWQSKSNDFRANCNQCQLNIKYGHHPREVFDLFLPTDNQPQGLFIFVHGGYWMKFDKSYWSYLAAGPVAANWAVAIPSYTLAPASTLTNMTKQITQFIERVSMLVEGPLHLAGHSAGGHLVSRMICEDTKLNPTTLSRIQQVNSLSGLHHLQPLINTKMNQTLGLTEQQAHKESVVMHTPVLDIPVKAWVGELERPEFIRQAQLLANTWTQCEAIVNPGHHHFSIINELTNPNSPMLRALSSDI